MRPATAYARSTIPLKVGGSYCSRVTDWTRVRPSRMLRTSITEASLASLTLPSSSCRQSTRASLTNSGGSHDNPAGWLAVGSEGADYADAGVLHWLYSRRSAATSSRDTGATVETRPRRGTNALRVRAGD